MSTVSRTECVVYVNLCIGCKLLCKFCVVLFLSCIKTDVFEKNCLALFKSCDLCFCIGTDYILGKGYLAAEQFVKSVCNGFKGELFLIVKSLFKKLRSCLCLLFSGELCNLFLFLFGKTEVLGKNVVGLTHMRAKYNLCALGEKILNGRKSLHYSLVTRDNAVFERNVKVASYKYLLACNVNVFDCFLVVSHIFDLLCFKYNFFTIV